MINVDLQQLVKALDAVTRQDLEGTAERCVARGGSRILVEDLLQALLDRPQGLLARALKDAGVEHAQLTCELQPAIEHSATCNPVFAPELVQWLQDALLVATLELGQNHIDQAALILAVLRNPLRYAGSRYQPLLARIDSDRLRDFALSEQPASGAGAASLEQESLLARFTHDLTRQARDGEIDPVLCRDDSIRQMIDILSRRRKNNPIVVGEAGVGKTAIVEGLALKIVRGEVPESLQGAELLSLDMGLLQAGASIKGEFERRLKGVMDEVRLSPRSIVLFIDEAHTLIGSGGQAGGSDAANLLKPALARGELRTIAATTWSEYKKYFEKDPALARRFQPVRVLEPTVDQAITILRGLAPIYEKSHGVYLRDDAVVAAARLSARYLSGRQLPDKAVDLLDTACARVRIGLAALPEQLESLRTECVRGQRQLEAMTRDAAAGLSVDQNVLDTLTVQLQQLGTQAVLMESRWNEQRISAGRVLDLRRQISQYQASPVDASPAPLAMVSELELTELRAEQALLYKTLADIPPTERLVSVEVCPTMVADVVSAWTGVPRSQLTQEYSATVATFASNMRARIRGQDQAVQALDRAMRAVAAGLNKPEGPVGVFLLVGPSGVGKTETAIALADLLYGGERFLTTINMSEFQEKHTVSRLIGAPPGYIGYGEGGMLTEAVRHKPYSVVLLDEVEKADPDVLNLFYQIFDKGVVNDGEGREIDFRNTLILMTSNLASERISALCHNQQRPDVGVLEAEIRPLLSAHFKPALLARMSVVPYYPIGNEVLRELVDIKLNRLGDRLQNRGVSLSLSPTLVTCVLERCSSGDSGARMIDHVLDTCVTPAIADRLLDAMSRCEPVSQLHVTLDGAGCIVCECA
ncbi:type VI secretion system ATPase TssH [Pseudomonas sp. CDFA 602]|uniref:type VI secretion system ATPase TssH n=1 Tax=Pseudomonas californiensis TaxID=2829823 RepID=UPI001E51BCB7|nr:type VI secretion system ATPase TssH [Pseudomonas californiensis]MCD5994601.1 type VI secretion system ATPase TssH [Pseudomonas californiensis]MCD6000037.1 type VI secretion system ATPase TssH [Pseudomonas californiensis]